MRSDTCVPKSSSTFLGGMASCIVALPSAPVTSFRMEEGMALLCFTFSCERPSVTPKFGLLFCVDRPNILASLSQESRQDPSDRCLPASAFTCDGNFHGKLNSRLIAKNTTPLVAAGECNMARDET
jgi:hypothetical protein